MQEVTVARYGVQEYRSHLPPQFNVMYCVRVSLRTVKIFLALRLRTTKEKGVVGNVFYISLCVTWTLRVRMH
jgi:hypothetical protein